MANITEQISLSLPLPIDKRKSNVILSGATIIIENEIEYFNRVDFNDRYYGLEIDFITPSGYVNINNYNDFLSLDTTKIDKKIIGKNLDTLEVPEYLNNSNKITWNDTIIKKTPTVGTIVTGNTIQEWIENAFFPFIPANLTSFSTNTIPTVEIGQIYYFNRLNYNINRNDSQGYYLKLYHNNSLLTSISGSTNGYYTLTPTISGLTNNEGSNISNSTFKGELIYTNKDNLYVTGNTLTITPTILAYYGCFFGSNQNILTGQEIYTTLKNSMVLTDKRIMNVQFNDTFKYFYFMYPSSWGQPISIIDNNGFNITNMLLTTSNITNNYGKTVTMNILRTPNKTTINGIFQYKF